MLYRPAYMRDLLKGKKQAQRSHIYYKECHRHSDPTSPAHKTYVRGDTTEFSPEILREKIPNKFS